MRGSARVNAAITQRDSFIVFSNHRSDRHRTLVLNDAAPRPAGPSQRTSNFHAPLMAKSLFAAYCPVAPAGSSSIGAVIGAMPGIAIEEPTVTVPTSIGWLLLDERHAMIKRFCPITNSPFSFSSAI